MSAVNYVEVGLIVDDPAAAVLARNDWNEPIVATFVQWRATGGERTVVCVTAFGRHTNRSWYDARYFVAEGLNAEPPPPWVPPAPDWFWAAVEELGR